MTWKCCKLTAVSLTSEILICVKFVCPNVIDDLDLYNLPALYLRWVNFNIMTPSFHLFLSLFPASPSLHLCFLPVLPSSRRGRLSPLFYIPPRVLWSEPCCTTAPQSGSWATCSRISSTSRFFPGGSTSFVIFCCSVRGNAISWINWPSGLLSTCGNTS